MTRVYNIWWGLDLSTSGGLHADAWDWINSIRNDNSPLYNTRNVMGRIPWWFNNPPFLVNVDQNRFSLRRTDESTTHVRGFSLPALTTVTPNVRVFDFFRDHDQKCLTPWIMVKTPSFNIEKCRDLKHVGVLVPVWDADYGLLWR